MQGGTATICAGQDAANFIGVPFSDARVPDLIGIAQYGTVYTGGTGKIAEHGGNNAQDRHVPILVSGGPVGAGGFNGGSAETTHIAPTILPPLRPYPHSLPAVPLGDTQPPALRRQKSPHTAPPPPAPP